MKRDGHGTLFAFGNIPGRRRWFLCSLLALRALHGADEPPGALVYRQRCGVCHDMPAVGSRIPAKSVLENLRAVTITKVLESGVMQEQAKGLSRADIRALATWLSKSTAVTAVRVNSINPCPAGLKWIRTGAAWQQWGAGILNSRYQPDSTITAANIANLRVKWAFGFADATAMRSQPVVVGNRVFVGSPEGRVYALDTATGCVHWAVEVAATVRTAIAIGEAGGRTMALVGDSAGFVYGLDAENGDLRWKLRPENHPVALITGTPVIYAGRAYFGVSSYEEDSALTPGYACCTFRGSINAVDAATGKAIWKTYTVRDEPRPRPDTKKGNKAIGPSGAGVWSSPTVDAARGRIYVTTGDNYSDPPTPMSDAVLALEMSSGEVVWVKQLTTGDAYNSSCSRPGKYNCPDSDGPDSDFGSPPILVELGSGRQALILSQKSGMVHAVDPARQGEILWKARVGAGGPLGGIQWGQATDGKNVYVAVSDIRFKGSKVLDREHGGGMFALRLDSGERVWQKPHPGCTEPRPCSPAQSAAVSMSPGIVFSGGVDGHLRGYAAATGAIVWDFDTARQFETVNGVPGRGGAMDVAGPAIAGSMLFVDSGYGAWGGLAGNVLLAFSPEGK
jgi:polyvinyl alcohol dehydrogenase (cytochrome)